MLLNIQSSVERKNRSDSRRVPVVETGSVAPEYVVQALDSIGKSSSEVSEESSALYPGPGLRNDIL